MTIGLQAVACAFLLALVAPGQALAQQPKPDVTKNDRLIRDYQDAAKLYQEGQFKQAEQKLKGFLEASPSHAGGNLVMGLTQIQLEDFEKARLYFRTAVKIDDKMVSARGYLGALEAGLGNMPGALEQKAALDGMKAACAGACPKAAEIEQAIARIEANLTAAKPG